MLKRKKLWLLTVILAFSVVNFGCSEKQNLQGANIVIGVFWGGYDVNTFEPQNTAQEKTLEWRTKIQKDNNFTMSEVEVGTWNEMLQLVATLILADDVPAGLPSNTLMAYMVQADWAMSLLMQDLIYPLSDNSIIDFYNPEPVEKGLLPVPWNQNTLKDFTFNNKIYAVSQDVNYYNFQVIFYNKRLFREAGLDPNLPYDMQKEGTWTWENFLDICRKLTRDVDNDGIIDTYALPRDLSTEILDAIIASNGANYVSRDPQTGKFELSINKPEFYEALQYAIRLNTEGVMKPRPEGTNWNWHMAEFADGNVAMRIDESNVWNELVNMRDDWGIVLFPKGPRVDNYRVYIRDNVLIIPSSYSKTDVEKILYAFALWHTPPDNDWKNSFYSRFRDSRAVDETLEFVRDTNLHVSKNHIFIPGLQRGNIAWEMWHHEGDPSQLIEEVTDFWEILVSDVNEELGFY